jgi:hypothetical protein
MIITPPPKSQHKVYFTEKGRSVEVRLAYDTDDDEFVSVNVLDRKSNGPFHGSAAIVDPNAALLIYTPAASFTGKDTFLCEVLPFFHISHGSGSG